MQAKSQSFQFLESGSKLISTMRHNLGGVAGTISRPTRDLWDGVEPSIFQGTCSLFLFRFLFLFRDTPQMSWQVACSKNGRKIRALQMRANFDSTVLLIVPPRIPTRLLCFDFFNGFMRAAAKNRSVALEEKWLVTVWLVSWYSTTFPLSRKTHCPHRKAWVLGFHERKLQSVRRK